MSDDFGKPPPVNPFASPQTPGYKPPATRSKNAALAITSLVLGVSSLALLPIACCCTPLGLGNLVLGMVGAVCGWVAYRQAQHGEAGGAGMALAGLICSSITIAIVTALFLFFLFGMLASI